MVLIITNFEASVYRQYRFIKLKTLTKSMNSAETTHKFLNMRVYLNKYNSSFFIKFTSFH